MAKKEKLRGVIMLEQIKELTTEDREFTIITLEGDAVLVSQLGRAIRFRWALWLNPSYLSSLCATPFHS